MASPVKLLFTLQEVVYSRDVTNRLGWRYRSVIAWMFHPAP